MKTELDLGCGTKKHKNAITLDMNPGVRPDKVLEIKRDVILPFKSNTFDKIWMIDFLEHIDDIAWLLSEVHRIGKPDSEVQIQYPHFSHRNTYSDVTHQQRLGIRSLDHFDPSTELGRKYQYYTFFGRNFPFKIENRDVLFYKGVVGTVQKTLHSLLGDDRYEIFVSSLLPIANIETRLRVLK